MLSFRIPQRNSVTMVTGARPDFFLFSKAFVPLALSFPPAECQRQLVAAAGNSPLISLTTRFTSSWSASAIMKNL